MLNKERAQNARQTNNNIQYYYSRLDNENQNSEGSY